MSCSGVQSWGEDTAAGSQLPGKRQSQAEIRVRLLRAERPHCQQLRLGVPGPGSQAQVGTAC